MERCWHDSLREDRCRRAIENPSFSSTLLDAIYRSIDEKSHDEEELVLYRESMRKKHGGCTAARGNGVLEEDDDLSSLRQAIMIEKWMEKKVSEKVVVCRKSAAAADFDKNSRRDREYPFIHSSSSSSDSSCGGGFSSSEAESIYGANSTAKGYSAQRPKPVRTSVSARNERADKARRDFRGFDSYDHGKINSAPSQKSKHEGSFVKTKSKALKIYGDLKKVKQPISPGARLASFLNSIFTTGNAKKPKISKSSVRNCDDLSSEGNSKSAYASTCSSASSFSRSCLSKTPSSRGKLSSNGAKRSVRFYPVSVIVDEDSRPCGHKNLHEDEPNFVAVTSVRDFANEELKFRIMETNRRVEEVTRDLLKNYQKKDVFDVRDLHHNNEESDNDDDDDDDAASYSSSDLFELDNLSAIGIERYRQELPVYETTHLDTNRAIANGLIL